MKEFIVERMGIKFHCWRYESDGETFITLLNQEKQNMIGFVLSSDEMNNLIVALSEELQQ